jgi:hypothetical protein
MRTNFVIYKGVRVCVLDFSSIPDEATAIAAVADAKDVISREPPKSVYTLTDVTRSRVTPKIRAALVDLTKANAPHVLAGAVVGATSIQMIVLRGIVQLTGRRLFPVASREIAFERLAEEARKKS